MLVEKTKDKEVHAFWDIPSVMLACCKILIERKDKKTYVIIIKKG